MNNIEKEFVPYTEALELKQLKFDEPCFGYYWIDNEELVLDINTPFQGYHKGFSGSISAPLYRQAFRWFREEYDLFGCIDLQVCTPSHWFIRVDKIEINDYLYHSEDENIRFNTYEEAELACLRKLIEIVKQKQQ